MNLLKAYGDALERRALSSDPVDFFRFLVLAIMGVLAVVGCAIAVIALIDWKPWIGGPFAAFVVYRLIRWAADDKKKEPTS